MVAVKGFSRSIEIWQRYRYMSEWSFFSGTGCYFMLCIET